MKLVYNLRERICRRFWIKQSYEQFSRTVDNFFICRRSFTINWGAIKDRNKM
jgi:hypothetical protein